MIDLVRTSDARLLAILSQHPRVARVEPGTTLDVEFTQGAWKRHVAVGDVGPEVKGLVELIDNNPLVCADIASVPDPVSTLALIALGPVALAGLVTESPSIVTNLEVDEDRLAAFLETAGWADGATVLAEPQEGVRVAAATVIVSIQNPDEWSEIDDLYEERYGKSFFVRRDETSEWDADRVLGQPFALYRLRYTPGENTSLLTIQVMADLDGKCGAAQVVHALNVMAGFEESLGVA